MNVKLTDEERDALADAFVHACEASCWSCEDGLYATVEQVIEARVTAAVAWRGGVS